MESASGPAELQDEFRYKNEKIKLNYAVIKPEELAAKITPTDAEIKAAYEKNKSRYQVPEKRVVRYGLLDTTQMRRNIQVSDDQLKVQYQNNIQQYQVPNRVHAEHILFMTVGKTDAEVDEIKKNAEDVLKQAKKGGEIRRPGQEIFRGSRLKREGRRPGVDNPGTNSAGI